MGDGGGGGGGGGQERQNSKNGGKQYRDAKQNRGLGTLCQLYSYLFKQNLVYNDYS